MVARARNVGGSGPTVWQAGHHSAGFSRSETQHVRLSESVPPCIIAHPNPLLIMQVFFFLLAAIFLLNAVFLLNFPSLAVTSLM